MSKGLGSMSKISFQLGFYDDVIFCGDNISIMRKMSDDCIDLTVTSPPYDDLRDYKGYSFDFEALSEQLYRITKEGGIVVWIVNDATDDGNETGTSFRQALYFKDLGFKLHDTMIWNKGGFTAVGSLSVRYASVFEFMFIFVKGKIKTFNPIKDRINKSAGSILHGTIRLPNGSMRKVSGAGIKKIKQYGQRFNIWDISPHRQVGGHPAPFPEELINDHVISWSNEDDLVFDPMCGSGTTLLMAKKNSRKFIGIDCSMKYCRMSAERVGIKKKSIIRIEGW